MAHHVIEVPVLSEALRFAPLSPVARGGDLVFAVVNEVYREFFHAPLPTRTFVSVASWPAEFDGEVDCVAHAPLAASRGHGVGA